MPADEGWMLGDEGRSKDSRLSIVGHGLRQVWDSALTLDRGRHPSVPGAAWRTAEVTVSESVAGEEYGAPLCWPFSLPMTDTRLDMEKLRSCRLALVLWY